MHLDIVDFFRTLVEIGVTLLRLIGLAKPTLDATKTGLEIFEEGKKLLEKEPEPDQPEQVTERVRAAADLLRSFAPVPYAEVLFWAFRGFFLLGLIRLYVEWYRIRTQNKSVR